MSKDLPGRILERNDNMSMESAIIRCGQEGALELGTAPLVLFKPISSHRVWGDCGTQGYAHTKPTYPRIPCSRACSQSLCGSPPWASFQGQACHRCPNLQTQEVGGAWILTPDGLHTRLTVPLCRTNPVVGSEWQAGGRGPRAGFS